MTSLARDISPPSPRAKPAAQVVEMLRIPHITLHAFCESPEMVAVMERVVADRRMSRAHATVHSGGIGAAIDFYRQAASPNLVLVESREAIADLRTGLDGLAEVCQTGTKVIVIGYTNDVTVYRELLAQGVSEYVVAPVDPISIVTAISRLYQDSGVNGLGRSVAFVGARGGVGSSTVANNVASMIARRYGRDVILTELDLPFGSASLDFSLETTQGIAQALQDPSRLDNVLLERLLTRCDEHLSVLVAPSTLARSYDLEEGALVRVIELAQASVPFVILDVPHIWTSWARKTLLSADEVVITATPDLTSLRNTKNLVDLLMQERPNDAPPRLVLNQVGVPKRAEIKPAEFAAALQIEPIACVPFEPSTLSAAANQGCMVADISSSSAAAKSFAKIAQTITGQKSAKTSWMSWFAFGPFGRG
jgi:pilus assembly protein CpaE